MPYPHHPQHQHNQKSHSPSQLRCVVTPHSYENGIKCTQEVNATTSAVTGPEGSPHIQQQVSTSSPLQSSFSSAALPTTVMATLENSTFPLVSNSTSQSHTPLSQSLSLSISESQENSRFLSSCQPREVDMMPLDLSFRAPRTESNPRQTRTPELQSGSCLSKPCSSSQSFSRSHRLSPYPLFTLGLSRSPGTTCMPLSRSPHSRSNSPFYHPHRQTPSPYYSCLSQHGSSYYNVAENSSFQVLSATNRVLNGLPGASNVFRPYDDHIPSEVTPPPASNIPADDEQQSQELDESEEPTYYDLDSVAQKQVTTPNAGNSFNNNICRSPSLYDNQFHGVTSLNVSHYNGSNGSPYIIPASVHEGAMTAFSTFSTSSSNSSSSPTSSTPPALLPSFTSQEVSEQAHCDLANQLVRRGGDTFPPYSESDISSQKSINQAITSHKVPILVQEQQDPDSSSGLSPFGFSSSSESPNSQRSKLSVSPTLCPSLQNSFDPSPQQYPDCDGSVTSTGTITSNKENFRDTQFRPQSFFRAPDKDFMEQTCRILAEKHRNEGAHRMSLLDFWISKIRIAAAQSRKSDTCRNEENKRKIKIRMVELMELQVEQSLRSDWR